MALPVIGAVIGIVSLFAAAGETGNAEKKAIKNAVDRAYKEAGKKITSELMSYLKTSFYGSLILGLSILLGVIFGDRALIITVNLAYLYILFTLLPIIKHLINLFKHKFNLKKYLYYLVYQEIYREVCKEVNQEIQRLDTIESICFELFGSSEEEISKAITQRTTDLVIKQCFVKVIIWGISIILSTAIIRMIIYPYIVEHHSQFSLVEVLLFPLYELYSLL